MDGREAGDFLKVVRRSFHQRQFAFSRKNDEMAAGEQQLAVAVMAVFPFALAGFGVEAG